MIDLYVNDIFVFKDKAYYYRSRISSITLVSVISWLTRQTDASLKHNPRMREKQEPSMAFTFGPGGPGGPIITICVELKSTF